MRVVRLQDVGTRLAIAWMAIALGSCTPKGVVYEPIPASSDYPLPESTIAGYVTAGDVVSMRRHAWQVFGAMVQPSRANPRLPLWETWYGKSEVKGNATCLEDTDRGAGGWKRDPGPDPQLAEVRAEAIVRARALGLEDSAVFDPLEIVRYNREACLFIKRNQLMQETVLSEWYGKGVRDIAALEGPADNRMVVVKTSWISINDGERKILSIWDGKPAVKGATSQSLKIHNDDRNDDGLRHVCVSTSRARCLDVAKAAWVPTDAFYHYRSGGSVNILVGLHIATREQSDWVWATFWWHDRRESKPYGSDRPQMVRYPWNNYLMNVAYDMDFPVEPDGGPHIAFNPWLEGFQADGLTSNCMACHRRASWSPNGETCFAFAGQDGDVNHTARIDVVVRGREAATGTYFNEPFEERLKLAFLWSLRPPPPAGFEDCRNGATPDGRAQPDANTLPKLHPK